MSLFRVIGDVIEYDGVPVAKLFPETWPALPSGKPRATLSPHVWPSLRSRVTENIEELTVELTRDEIEDAIDTEREKIAEESYQRGFADGKASWGAP